MGGNIIPMLVERGEADVYDFARQHGPGRDRARPRLLARRRDARRLLRRAHGPRLGRPGVQPLQPRVADPHLDRAAAAGKFVFDEHGRAGLALDSLVCAGVVVSGATVRRSILSPGVHVHSHAQVEGSVLMHGVNIGRGAVVRNAILDKTSWSPGVRNRRRPRARPPAFTVSDDGIVVLGKGAQVSAVGAVDAPQRRRAIAAWSRRSTSCPLARAEEGARAERRDVATGCSPTTTVLRKCSPPRRVRRPSRGACRGPSRSGPWPRTRRSRCRGHARRRRCGACRSRRPLQRRRRP